MPQPPPDLRPLADTDPAALIAYLCEGPRFGEALLEVLDLIQTRPTLFHGLREALPPSRLEQLRLWVARRLLADSPDLGVFCATATAVVQARAPDFPVLTSAPLVVTSSWYAGWIQEADTRVDGIGWVLRVEEGHEGPAEAIHVESWQADAYGDGWRQRIAREAVQRRGSTWAELPDWGTP